VCVFILAAYLTPPFPFFLLFPNGLSYRARDTLPCTGALYGSIFLTLPASGVHSVQIHYVDTATNYVTWTWAPWEY
jgi:hypothetical protein